MDVTKKGTKFTLPKKGIEHRVLGWKERTTSYRDHHAGNWVSFGKKVYQGKTWVLYEKSYYAGSMYWMSPLDKMESLLNIKKTNMATKMTAVAAATAKAFPKIALKTGMPISGTGIKGDAIIVKEGNTVFICSNSTTLDGSAPIKKYGFKYGWTLRNRGTTTVDLTYSGRFSSIKLGAVPVAKKAVKTPVKKAAKTTTGKTEFVNSFGVVGSKTLLKAFAEEAVAAGWNHDKSTSAAGYPDLYFTTTHDGVSPAFSFRADGVKSVKPAPFKLPAQWDAAIKAMKEKKVVTKFPIYCIAKGNCSNQYTKGRIYKITKEHKGTYFTATDDNGSTTNGWGKEQFTLSTEKAFKAQAPLFVPIKTLGGWSVSVSRASVPGYGTAGIPVICIGCTDSQEVYTKKSLASLLYALKSCGPVTHGLRGVKMDVKTVETLIQMLDKA